MNKLNADNFPELICKRPEKIIQFGEGNFIRAFMDWIIQQLNNQNKFNGSVVAIQPTPHGKVVGKLNTQNGLFTKCERKAPKFIYGDISSLKNNDTISLFFYCIIYLIVI